MLKTVLIISLISFAGFVHSNSCSNAPIENSNYQPVPKQDQIAPEASESNENGSTSADLISISELNKQKPENGTFETKGFIAKVFTCPPCPPGAQCKPCMKDNIVISEEKKTLENYDIGHTELIIFTNEDKKYAVGEQYEFKIRITENKTTASELNDIELISSKRIN